MKKYAFSLPLLIMSAALYLTHLQRILGYDEFVTLMRYAHTLVSAVFSYIQPNNHILHSVLVYSSSVVAGHSLFALRFPAFAGALLSVAWAYRIGSRTAGTRVGLAAAVFLATDFWFEDYATQARGYTLSIFFTLWLVDLLLSPTSNRRRYHYAILVSSAGMVLVLPSMVIPLAGIILYILLAKPARDRLRLLAPVITGALCASCLYIPHVFNGNFGNQLQAYGYTDFGLLVSDWAQKIFPASILGAFLVLCLIGGLIRIKMLPTWDLILLQFAVALILAIIQFIVLKKLYYPRNYIYLLPFTCLLMAHGLFAVARRATPLIAAGLMLLGLVVFNAPDDLAYTTVLVNLIHEKAAPTDWIAVEYPYQESATYYLDRQGCRAMYYEAGKTRLIVIEPPDAPLQPTLEYTTDENAMFACTLIGGWEPFHGYSCTASLTSHSQ